MDADLTRDWHNNLIKQSKTLHRSTSLPSSTEKKLKKILLSISLHPQKVAGGGLRTRLASCSIGSGLTHRRRSRKVAPSNRACLQMLQADEQPDAAGRPVPRNKASPNAARSGPACIAADLVFADSATGASS